jgi:hypothetical protein
MASFLSELGKEMRCRDERGRIVACPTRLGCGLGGCMGSPQLVPFDLPLIGHSVDLSMTDAMLGAVIGKSLSGVAAAVVRFMKGPEYGNWTKIALGIAAAAGLASNRLRYSSLFVGASFPVILDALSPMTDWLAIQMVKGVEKTTGWALTTAPAAAAAGMRGLLGQGGEGYRVRPSLRSPSQLIATGSRSVGMIGTSMMGARQFGSKQINSLRA